MRSAWHIWVVGLIALAWNGFAAMDYVMVQSNNVEYLAQFSTEQLSFFKSLPIWANAAWAVAVWFGVMGSLMILARKAWAVPILMLSLLAMMITAFQNFYLANPGMQEVVGKEALYFTLLIFFVALLLWLYARFLAAKNLLR